MWEPNEQPTIWGWFLALTKMVMTWGWFTFMGLPHDNKANVHYYQLNPIKHSIRSHYGHDIDIR